ncbi:MAG: ABC transporter permease [Rhodospirillales bacterium]|nr:ABC transporter permease [Rhodospirillales bacterium]
MAARGSVIGLIVLGSRSRAFVIGGAISTFFLAIALIALVWTPHSVFEMAIKDRMQGPSWDHLLGTDQFGRDLLSMLMVGASNSIGVAVVAVGVGLAFGVPLGGLAASRRGWIDELVMRFNDFAFAFPALLSAVMITAVFGPGSVNSIIAIGIFNVPVFARVTRGGALALWQREYVLAARMAGKGRARITLEHILPNIASLLIVQGTIQFALGILAEAGLSYLGLGTQPPLPSWGKMLAEAQTMLYLAPQLAILPGLAIMLTVLGLNLLGDGLRDLLDPRLRRAR